jgi:Ca2+-binding EF-hand superfamily protein
MRAWITRGITLLAGASFAALALAGGAAAATADDWMLLQLQGQARPGVTAETLRERMRGLFLTFDIDGGGISQSDYDTLAQIQHAARRSQMVAQTLVNDLDGDGQVTRAEIEVALGKQARQPISMHGTTVAPTAEQIAKILRGLVDEALKPDRDGDGVITMTEMLAAASARLDQESPKRLHQVVPFSFDSDGDRTVSLAEFEAVVARVLASMDTDGNGRFSVEEVDALSLRLRRAQEAVQESERQRREQEEIAKKAARCALPKVPADATLLLVGVYEGKAVSDVSIGGDDVEVGVAQIEIEQGDEPLYIVATSYEAMIWQVSGAIDRVQALVATSMKAGGDKLPRVGVVGLPRERVASPAAADCLRYFSSKRGSEWDHTVAEVRGLLGKAPDDVVGIYGAARISLPSGIAADSARYANVRAMPLSGPSVAMWREALRFAPGGVAQNDPREVVSPLPVAKYAVLPQQAGLAQLIEEGALEVIGMSQVIELGGTRIITPGAGGPVVKGVSPHEVHTMPSELRILRKMRFPAGLSGAHAVRFVLARGVPYPDGDPGHSCVRSEETGAPVGSRRC